MKKNILFAALMAASIYSAKAQFKLSQDIVGTPVETRATDGYVGDRYLYPEWLTGHVLQEDEKYFNNMSLKYDAFNDRVIFNSNDNGPMAFKFPINEFQILHKKSLTDPITLFKNGFPPVGTYTSKSFYQVLTEGKTTLVKKPYKSIVESTPYGESGVKKTFVFNELYFLYHNGQMTKIQRSKNSVLDVLADKKLELANFIKDKKLGVKSDSDLTAIVNYYNSLK